MNFFAAKGGYMRMCLTLLLTVLLFFRLSAQEAIPDDSSNRPKLVVHYFTYPNFMNGEVHSSFLLNYQLSDKAQLELQAFYDNYLLTDRFRASMAFKRYLTKKFYLFAGVEMEAEFVKGNILIKKRPPRIGVISGFGYDVNSNFTMEAKSNIGINQSSMGVFGEALIPMPKVYTIGGKIKF